MGKLLLAILAVGVTLIAPIARSIDLRPGGLVKELVFGPTIDGAKDAGDRVVDRGAAKFDALMKKADDLAKERTVDLQLAMEEQVNVALKQGDEELQNAFEELRATGQLYQFFGNSFVAKAGVTLRESIYLLIIGALVVVAVVFVLIFIRDRERHRRKSRSLLVATVCIVGAVGAVFLTVRASDTECRAKANDATQDKTDYATNYSELSFTNARYNATALTAWAKVCASQEEKQLWSLRARKAELLERVLRKPGSYADKSRLYGTLGDLAFFLEETSMKLSRAEVSDVYTALALVHWIAEDDRDAEFNSAKAAAAALRPFVTTTENTTPIENWTEVAPLLPLASHYLALYLSRPMSDAELEIRDHTSADIKLARELPILARAMSSTTDKGSNVGKRFASYSQFGQWRSEFLRVLVPKYVCIVERNTRAELTYGTRASGLHVAARDKCAEEIFELYEGEKHPSQLSRFVREVVDNQSYSGTQIRVSALRAPHVLYERAKTYYQHPLRGAGEPARTLSIRVGRARSTIRIPAVPAPVQPIPPKRDIKLAMTQSPGVQLLEKLPEGDVGPFTRKKLKEAIERELPLSVDELIEFETAYLDHARAVEHSLALGRKAFGDSFFGIEPNTGLSRKRTPSPAEIRWRAHRDVVAGKLSKAAEHAGKLGLFRCTQAGMSIDCHRPDAALESLALHLGDFVFATRPTDLRAAHYASAKERLWVVP